MRSFILWLLVSQIVDVSESARLKTQTVISTNDECDAAVPGSLRRMMASVMTSNSDWCTCPTGMRVMRKLETPGSPKTEGFCDGSRYKFNPRQLDQKGCECRVPDEFVCPEECWQCCKSSEASSLSPKFKCVLKSETELPPGRTCGHISFRSYNKTTAKAHCSAEFWEELYLPTEECETVSSVRKHVNWGLEKLKEVPKLLFTGASNLAEMGKVIKYIHDRATTRLRFLPLSQLMMIHPIEMQPAQIKTAKRARIMRGNLAILQEHGLKFSEDLAKNYPDFAIMTSKEGFEVIQVSSDPDRYVIMEGNGRLCATRWAFPDNEEFQSIRDSLQLEVREHLLEGEQQSKAVRRITELRASYNTDAYEALFPPSLEEDEVLAYWKKVWKAGVGPATTTTTTTTTTMTTTTTAIGAD